MTFSISGLNHLGLVVEDIELAKDWFCKKLACPILEDRGELVFILVGRDILALKTPRMAVSRPEHGQEASGDWSKGKAGWQALDHYGFYARSPEEVDAFAVFLQTHGIEILKGPYSRRDGRSVYFRDPCGNVGEYLYWQGASEDASVDRQ